MDAQIAQLTRYRTISSVKHALSQLPPSLDGTYTRILESIPEEYQREVFHALQLLVVSYRALALDEVAEAIVIDYENEKVSPEDRFRDSHDIIEI